MSFLGRLAAANLRRTSCLRARPSSCITIKCHSSTKASEDPRHSDEYLDLENTKPYVKNPNIRVTQRCEDIFLEILKLDTMEVCLLTALMQEKVGAIPGAPAMGMSGQTSSAGKGDGEKKEEAEEKTAFDVKLTAFDSKSKIKIIKEVRSVSGLGLKDAKELVEGLPKVVKKDVKKEEAERLKAQFEALGGTVEVL